MYEFLSTGFSKIGEPDQQIERVGRLSRAAPPQQVDVRFSPSLGGKSRAEDKPAELIGGFVDHQKLRRNCNWKDLCVPPAPTKPPRVFVVIAANGVVVRLMLRFGGWGSGWFKTL